MLTQTEDFYISGIPFRQASAYKLDTEGKKKYSYRIQAWGYPNL
jgi:hypothetical protein